MEVRSLEENYSNIYNTKDKNKTVTDTSDMPYETRNETKYLMIFKISCNFFFINYSNRPNHKKQLFK